MLMEGLSSNHPLTSVAPTMVPVIAEPLSLLNFLSWKTSQLLQFWDLHLSYPTAQDQTLAQLLESWTYRLEPRPSQRSICPLGFQHILTPEVSAVNFPTKHSHLTLWEPMLSGHACRLYLCFVGTALQPDWSFNVCDTIAGEASFWSKCLLIFLHQIKGSSLDDQRERKSARRKETTACLIVFQNFLRTLASSSLCVLKVSLNPCFIFNS